MRITCFIIFCLAFMMMGCNTASKDTANKTAMDSVRLKTDLGKLAGDWVRTDGGYMLRIYSAADDGKLDAAYFNPNPIHVGKAEWNSRDNTIFLTVRLQDVNYPGSTYTLQYFPTGDRLAGNYYQAVEGADFAVEFMRQQ